MLAQEGLGVLYHRAPSPTGADSIPYRKTPLGHMKARGISVLVMGDAFV